ncbi:MAG: hypothetical protein Q4Q58_03620 [Thermoplasmata archaeon]|nr:hypothetical protein [Thermoplasmata archaeon]
MAVTNVDYLERFLGDVDKVTAGHPGAISEDRWLSNNYDSGKLRLILPYLEFDDPRVRAETVTLLGNVRERGAMERISRMKGRDDDSVTMACLGYLTLLNEDDEAIPGLLDVMEHTRGSEFSQAARRMAAVARTEDLPRVRKIYGQVGGTMRDETRQILDRIIARDPELAPKKDLILSIPVYPDEARFESFLDSSIEYLDVRYRENVLPRESISAATFNNVARAIRKMRTRLYNEADNLQYYGPDKEDRFRELSDLVRWANSDLAGKTVIQEDRAPARACPRCGNMLVCYKGMWVCPDCGGNL